MFKIKIFTIGKIKEPWLEGALADYTRRLSPHMELSWQLLKDLPSLEKALLKESAYIALDPQGKLLSSPQFSTLLFQELETHGSRLNFLIGGDEGLSPSLKEGANLLLSLSPLTFTHQLTRLILLEQFYRATQIRLGTPYHK